MTSVSKNVYIDKLDDIVNKYNNAYHRTMKPENEDENENEACWCKVKHIYGT